MVEEKLQKTNKNGQPIYKLEALLADTPKTKTEKVSSGLLWLESMGVGKIMRGK